MLEKNSCLMIIFKSIARKKTSDLLIYEAPSVILCNPPENLHSAGFT